MNRFTHFGLMAAMSMLTIPIAQAQQKTGSDRYSIALKNVNVHPSSLAEARKTLDRIKDAALTLCGAPQGSSTYMRRAIKKSQCFEDSVAEAVRSIDDPLINRLHQRLR